MNFTLRKDQIEDLSYFLSHPKALFLSDPGTGKTPVVNVLQRARWDENNVATAWPMPDKLMEKNKEEAIRFGQWTNSDDVVIVRNEKDFQKPGRVYIMTFKRFRLSWRAMPPQVTALDIDEFHKGFGGADSAQTKAMFQFMKERGTHFLPMTGTLFNGKPDTCYPAIHAIESRYYGCYDQFKNYHHTYDLFTGKLNGYQNLDHLQRLLLKHGRRRLWEEVHGPSLKVIHKEIVEMEPEQRDIYDKLKNEAVVELERFFIDGTLPGVNFIRCRQVMEHPNYFPDLTEPGKFVDLIPGRRPPKLDLLDLHFENHATNSEPLIVYASLISQQRQIYGLAQQRGLRVGLINGQISSTEAATISKQFESGTLNTLICSPLVADTGFNWQFCGEKEVSHQIVASMDFRDSTFIQAYRRSMRQPRSKALRITILQYRNSLDNRITHIVNKKSKEANKVDQTREILEL